MLHSLSQIDARRGVGANGLEGSCQWKTNAEESIKFLAEFFIVNLINLYGNLSAEYLPGSEALGRRLKVLAKDPTLCVLQLVPLPFIIVILCLINFMDLPLEKRELDKNLYLSVAVASRATEQAKKLGLCLFSSPEGLRKRTRERCFHVRARQKVGNRNSHGNLSSPLVILPFAITANVFISIFKIPSGSLRMWHAGPALFWNRGVKSGVTMRYLRHQTCQLMEF